MSTDNIVVLMYHRIGQANNAWERKYCVSPERFAAQMAALYECGMKAVSIDECVAWIMGDIDLPAGSFLITFDDGFRGVADFAVPILQRYNWPAAIFLVTDLIGKQDDWTRSLNPDGKTYSLLDADEIRNLAQRGISFHSHTRSHSSLPKLDGERLAIELNGSREHLRDAFGFDSKFLAYPFGHLDERVEAETKKAGYCAAFSTQPGFNRRDVNPFRIRRLDIFGTDTPSMLLRKIKLGSNDGSLAFFFRYYWDRLKNRLGGLGR